MSLALASFAVPSLLSRPLDAFARRLTQPKGMAFDFSTPVGEPALVPPDSVSWQVFKNHVTLYVGGIAAVILELAEPHVRDGVWQHSSFRTDALDRMQRTALAAMATVYGARSRAERMIDGVNRRHRRIAGTTTDGRPYRADDPLLLDWVQATAGFGFMEAYDRYARPLSEAQRNAFLAEGREAALLYGATGAPASTADLAVLFEVMHHRLVDSPIVHEFLSIMREAKILPGPLHPLQNLMTKAAIDLLPPWVRDRLDLWKEGSLRPMERRLVRALAAGAERLPLASSAPVQACRRLGLPANHLFR